MQFAGHDTFHIRDGWLHKGLNVVSKNPEIFSDKYATDTFGVGRNMVDAIRYWLNASGLIENGKVKSTAENAGSKVVFSSLGKLLYRRDRFIEEDLSLWALHFQLATNQDKATAWFWFFNKLPVTRFDSQICLNYLVRWIEQTEVKKKPNLTSLQKDINCLLRTYTKAHGKRRADYSPEDSFECPLASLQLVDFLEHSDSYKLNFGKRMVPVAAFAYAVLSFMNEKAGRERKLDFRKCYLVKALPAEYFYYLPKAYWQILMPWLTSIPNNSRSQKQQASILFVYAIRISHQFQPLKQVTKGVLCDKEKSAEARV